MKKLALFLMCMISISAFSGPIPSPSTPKLIINATDTPLPMVGTVAMTIAGTTTLNIGAINGYNTVITFAVGTAAAVICPDIGALTKKVLITTTADCNVGDATVTNATSGVNFIPEDCPGFPFVFGTKTPTMYFRTQAKTGTVSILPAIEP